MGWACWWPACGAVAKTTASGGVKRPVPASSLGGGGASAAASSDVEALKQEIQRLGTRVEQIAVTATDAKNTAAQAQQAVSSMATKQNDMDGKLDQILKAVGGGGPPSA